MKKIFLILMLICSTCFAQEAGLDYIGDNSDESRIILNEQLRRTSRRLRNLEDGLNINTETSGILTVDRGGTGVDLSTNNQGDLYYDNGTGEFTRLTPGTSGQFLKTQGTSANPTWDDVSTVEYVAGNLQEMIAATERSVTTTSYSKIKELTPVIRGGTVKISWQSSYTDSPGRNAQVRLYINSIAVGTEKNVLSGGSYSGYSEASVSIIKGDIIQIYGKQLATGSGIFAKDMQFLVAELTIPVEVL